MPTYRPSSPRAKFGRSGGPDMRRRQLARIHMLAAELGLDRATYEAALWTLAKVDSAADLDTHGRTTVIEHFEARLGRSRQRIDGTPPRTLAQRPMLRKIAAQLHAAGRGWPYAEALAQQLARKQALEFCSDAELGKIVAALAIDAKRHGR